jgi:hypothetical protein
LGKYDTETVRNQRPNHHFQRFRRALSQVPADTASAGHSCPSFCSLQDVWRYSWTGEFLQSSNIGMCFYVFSSVSVPGPSPSVSHVRLPKSPKWRRGSDQLRLQRRLGRSWRPSGSMIHCSLVCISPSNFSFHLGMSVDCIAIFVLLCPSIGLFLHAIDCTPIHFL